jgi:PAS domain S-box-containing protein
MGQDHLKNNLRVLILEDVPTDAELVEQELRSAGIELVSTRVDNQDSFSEALSRFAPEIILSDYSLPAFDGESALSMALEKAPGVPFIFVTGALGEERAIDLMKSGATDFVLKDRLSRLPLCVKRALEEVEEKRLRRRAEEECARLAGAVEQASESIIMVNPQLVIEYVNPAFELINGHRREEGIGKTYSDLLGAPEDEGMRDAFRQGQHWKGRLSRKRKDGRVFELEVVISPVRNNSGKILNYLIMERDITREVRLQQQLRQAQKMEAIGTLTGGIAHDFNNILATIVINSEMALFDLPGGSRVRTNLDLILKSGLRGKDLVKQMLLFSRKSEKKQEVLTLTPLIKETFKLLRSSIPTTIQMELHLKTESDSVSADPSQVQQVIMNLCTNAAYAMRGTTGSIDISLQGITFGSTDLPEADMQPGDYLVLSVKDTGSGMDEEVRRRIFEPFFTTKPVGEGTGLGLSVVYGIVKSHRGGITVYSEPGKGSVFKVYLPKVDTGVAERAETPKPIPRGNERILLLDDEEIIVNSVRNMLQHLGYRVTALMDNREALKLFSERPSEFDLVITDQTMPFMTGENLGKELMRIRSDIPVILCTGYSDMISSEKATAMGFRGFIMKPFTVREGAELVRRVLDRKKPSNSSKSP